MDKKLKIKEMIIEHLELNIKSDEITDEIPLFEEGGLELDSIEMLEILSAVEKEFNIQIILGDEPAKDFYNVNSIVKMIDSLMENNNESDT